MYTYRKNIFGDIIGIYDANNTCVAKYVYDAWGNHKVLNPDGTENTSSTFIGNVNPIRYRGYYYDVETGLYYCNSRYYSPELCRLISPDSFDYLDPESIHGLNLYAYCYNNPINNYDPTGHFPWLILALLLFTAIGGTLFQIATPVLCYAGMLIASLFNEQIKQDLENINYNPFNSSETDVINSQKVSFYKGVPVFKINNGKGSMSFGAIFFDTNSAIAQHTSMF